MESKLTRLGFVIGAFFSIVSIVLFANIFLSGRTDRLNVISSVVFLIFGIAMMIAAYREVHEEDNH